LSPCYGTILRKENAQGLKSLRENQALQIQPRRGYLKGRDI